ncbi:hypothetical protein [Paenibacillus sp. FSL R7-0337]|uniref:hypothetical protein n=1 Tax=Paenibacillus sp. FSL R7-0337 TaxID=1926588 RepID=UPI00117EF658|nr:hypothetical protein [Paenibacillus sp. FSL R7-0337]
MKMVKTLLVASLIFLLTAPISAESYAADVSSETSTFNKAGSISEIKTVTPEMQSSIDNSITWNSTNFLRFPKGQISPLAADLSYTIKVLPVGRWIQTDGTLYVSSSTPTVYLSHTQHTPGGTGSVRVYYYLKSTTSEYKTNVIKVVGSYVGSNNTIYWNNVPEGYYKLIISNEIVENGGLNMAGNGFLNAL